MISALLLALTLPSALPADDPPIRVRLNDERYNRGDRARVWVETERDGYVVVLHADSEGRLRVLFPLDPTHDAFVRGGRKLEVRGRGDRQAFFVDVREGTGVVLAAYSPDPFRFDPFVRGDHWDYRVLGGPEMRDDPEAALLDMARQMAGGDRFEYDVASYVVGSGAGRYYRYSGWSPYRFRFGFHYGSFYNPYFYDPFCYDPWWGYDPFCYRYGYGFRYSTTYFAWPYTGSRIIYRTPLRSSPRRFMIPRERETVKPIEPRRRTSVSESPSQTATVRGPRSVRSSDGNARVARDGRGSSSVRSRPSEVSRPRATPSRGSTRATPRGTPSKSAPPRRRN